MIKRIKKMKKLIKFSFILILCLILMCASFAYIGFHSYHLGWINADQLGYLGSIVGGGMTIYGVLITVLHTDKQNKLSQKKHDQERREDFSMMYMPIPAIVLDEKINCALISGNPALIQMDIKIKNIGHGEARNINLKVSNNQNILYSQHITTIIPLNETEIVTCFIPIPNFSEIYSESILVDLSFTDLLNVNEICLTEMISLTLQEDLTLDLFSMNKSYEIKKNTDKQ